MAFDAFLDTALVVLGIVDDGGLRSFPSTLFVLDSTFRRLTPLAIPFAFAILVGDGEIVAWQCCTPLRRRALGRRHEKRPRCLCQLAVSPLIDETFSVAGSAGVSFPTRSSRRGCLLERDHEVNRDTKARVASERGGSERRATDKTDRRAITPLTRGLLRPGGGVTRCIASFRSMPVCPDRESRAGRTLRTGEA